MMEECRRCGEIFEKDEPDMVYVCDRCLRLDWEEAGDLPEHDDDAA
jgi:predicted  nucleic acid-binding Zn-ribbon protein